MHETQKHILRILSCTKKARYADIKPKTVEGNLFTYHLKTLAREGYITAENSTYHLTAKGKRYVDRVSMETFQERIQPKIVTILVLEKEGNYLLYKRRRAPFIERIGFPYGKIHLGERLQEAAERELNEKTGLEAVLKHRGDVYLTVHDETELVSHMLCHVFSGKNPTGTLLLDTTFGTCFWGRIDDVSKKDLIPGVTQIRSLIKKTKGLFFEEYFLNTTDEE